jgi:hypothetical protein
MQEKKKIIKKKDLKNKQDLIQINILYHQVKNGDMYRFKLFDRNNKDEIGSRLFFIKSITDNYIDFDYFIEEDDSIWENEYNQLKKTNKRKIKHKGPSGIMINNEMKLNFSHSTKDLMYFCLDNYVGNMIHFVEHYLNKH